MVAKEGVWPGLFGEFFMGVSVEENENCEAQDKSDDDMLFYVQNKPHSSDNEVINDKILLFQRSLLRKLCKRKRREAEIP